MNDLNVIIKRIWEDRTFDSHVCEDGWTATGYSEKGRYVAFNKYTRGKVVYVVKAQRNKLSLQMIISVTNPRKNEFHDSVVRNEEQCFSNNRDCWVERSIMVDSDIDTVIGRVFGVLDDFYAKYNEIVAPGLLARASKSSGATICVEELPLQILEPRYDLSWNGWESFYKEWDAFVESWYDSKANPTDPFTQSLANAFNQTNPDVRLDIRELPEPYYGDGKTAKGVIVHLNPGASSKSEDSKIFGGNGDLILSFATDCGKKYSRYAEKWSSLRDAYEGYPAKDVPGYDWWHERNRVRFFERFWGITDLAEVFALEACPYHSKDWAGGLDRIEKHIIDKVIAPAAVIANRHNNCAVFVGSRFNEIIAKVRGVTAIGCWRGTRVYSLYKLVIPLSMREPGKQNQDTAYFLVINGMQGMRLPALNEANKEIENKILNMINQKS